PSCRDTVTHHPLSLHDALPIWATRNGPWHLPCRRCHVALEGISWRIGRTGTATDWTHAQRRRSPRVAAGEFSARTSGTHDRSPRTSRPYRLPRCAGSTSHQARFPNATRGTSVGRRTRPGHPFRVRGKV